MSAQRLCAAVGTGRARPAAAFAANAIPPGSAAQAPAPAIDTMKSLLVFICHLISAITTILQKSEQFHAHNIPVCSIPFEGGETEEVYFKLFELGCDGFSTDYPSVMFSVIRKLKE